MPIQTTPRGIIRYNAALEKLNIEEFLHLTEEILHLPSLSNPLNIRINLTYWEGTTVTGDLDEVKKLIPEIPEDVTPQSYSLQIMVDGNPRKSININVSFFQSWVAITFSNNTNDEFKALKEVVQKFIPKTHNFANKAKGSIHNITQNAKIDSGEYLPGIFRSIPMPDISEKDVFVIMSFEEKFRDTYFMAIKPTLIKLGFNPKRVDEIQHNATVTPEIVRQIEKSAFIVADLSGERPNVYYEVGYAHRAEKEVILMAKNDQAVHFDVASINRINYNDLTELTNALELRIKSIIEKQNTKSSF